MSPVAMCGIPNSAEIPLACVPFPDPCGPSKRMFTGAPPGNTRRPLARDLAAPESTLALAQAPSLRRERWRPLAWCSQPRDSAASPGGALSEEALVGAHHHLRLHLAHRVERDADDDQHRGAAEGARGCLREAAVADEEAREHGDESQVERPGQRQPGQHAVEVLSRRRAWADAWDVTAVLAEV